jgi:hypothetical protein
MNFMESDWRKKEFYEIRIKGHLAPFWSEMFDGMQLTLTQRGEPPTPMDLHPDPGGHHPGHRL